MDMRAPRDDHVLGKHTAVLGKHLGQVLAAWAALLSDTVSQSLAATVAAPAATAAWSATGDALMAPAHGGAAARVRR